MAIDIASKETTRILRQVDNDLNNIQTGVNTNSTLISSTLARVNVNSTNISANHTAILTNSTHISSTRARVNTNSTLISSTLARVNTTSANHSTLCSSIGTTTRTNSALNSSIISMLANGTYRDATARYVERQVSVYSRVSLTSFFDISSSYVFNSVYSGTGFYAYVAFHNYLWVSGYHVSRSGLYSQFIRLNTYAAFKSYGFSAADGGNELELDFETLHNNRPPYPVSNMNGYHNKFGLNIWPHEMGYISISSHYRLVRVQMSVGVGQSLTASYSLSSVHWSCQ